MRRRAEARLPRSASQSSFRSDSTPPQARPGGMPPQVYAADHRRRLPLAACRSPSTAWATSSTSIWSLSATSTVRSRAPVSCCRSWAWVARRAASDGSAVRAMAALLFDDTLTIGLAADPADEPGVLEVLGEPRHYNLCHTSPRLATPPMSPLWTAQATASTRPGRIQPRASVPTSPPASRSRESTVAARPRTASSATTVNTRRDVS